MSNFENHLDPFKKEPPSDATLDIPLNDTHVEFNPLKTTKSYAIVLEFFVKTIKVNFSLN